MASYKTPGIYVEEISKLPASVAQVETAIPAFIGYTEKAVKNGRSIVLKPTKIKSLLEYEVCFGVGPSPKKIDVTLDANNGVSKVEITPNFYLYDSLRMFYINGGGDCYIVSVKEGGYPSSTADVSLDELTAGLNTLLKEDEPTLIIIPEQVLLDDSEMATLQQAVLSQCNTLQDRFGIFDIKDDEEDGVDNFRDGIGVNSLKYGAAYFPFLRTTLSFNYDYSAIRSNIVKNNAPVTLSGVSPDSKITDQLDNVLDDLASPVEAFLKNVSSVLPAPFNVAPYEVAYDKAWSNISSLGTKAELETRVNYLKELLEAFIALTGFKDKDDYNEIDDKTVADLHNLAKAAGTAPNFSPIEKCIRTLLEYDMGYTVNGGTDTTPLAVVDSTSDFAGYDLTNITANSGIYGPTPAASPVKTVVNAARPYFQALHDSVIELIKDFYNKVQARATNLDAHLKTSNPIYANIVKAIKEEGIVLPPSGAIAGIYAYVDSNRGVWKAPANVSISAVVGPTIKIDDNDQRNMNVDVNGGKSVNAIRSFAGKGTLVWGARTLAGNDNEWRYIPVRRLYNMVEESVKKATSWVVFEPNDANTWVKVKGQIENFLNTLWRDGALAGAVPADAYFVMVGLGTTMTSQDILEGRINIEIGMAAVRPAEFIILKFSHMLQKS